MCASPRGAGCNYYPFLWRLYRSHRATLFTLLDSLTLRTTTQDTGVEEAVRFLRDHAGRTGPTLPTVRAERGADGAVRTIPLLDLSWIPDGWWRLVTGEHTRATFPERVQLSLSSLSGPFLCSICDPMIPPFLPAGYSLGAF